MYMSATLSIDPTQLTHIRRKPTKGFRRFAELLTANLLSEKEEHETFTALSILQEINVALRSIDVCDVVTFSKDGILLYDDKASSSSDDMSAAIDALIRQGMHGSSDVFSELSLMLEHHLTRVAVIIEIRIRRVHDIGAYPIRITLNGLDAQFQAAATQGSLNNRLEEVFATQQTYDGYTSSIRQEFEDFVDQLENAIRSKMRVDNIHRRVSTNVVRPGLELPPAVEPASKLAGQNQPGTAAAHESAPMFQRYGVGADTMMYMWMWSSMMHSHNTNCHNTTIVSEDGQPAFSVGDVGFNAAENQTLLPGAPLELPDCPIEGASESLGEIDGLNDSDMGMLATGVGDETTKSGWLDFFAFGDSSGSDGSAGANCASDGGSSCGGGGGCGGGCSS